MQPETINLLVELIQTGMGLDVNHVVTYNQQVPIPPDDGLFIAVGVLDEKPFAGSLSYSQGQVPPGAGVTPGGTLLESQTLNQHEVYSIHVMSRSNLARTRARDVVFALSNTRAVQIQERYGLLIGSVPISFADASMEEGAGRLNRYVITIGCQRGYCRVGAVDYYDNFTGSPAIIAQP